MTLFKIRAVNFEDSQVDNFVPYSSPSVLFWQSNKKLLNDLSVYNIGNKYSTANLSDIERPRGIPSSQDSSSIIQMPAGKYFIFYNVNAFF